MARFELTYAGVKVLCLNQLGDIPKAFLLYKISPLLSTNSKKFPKFAEIVSDLTNITLCDILKLAEGVAGGMVRNKSTHWQNCLAWF